MPVLLPASRNTYGDRDTDRAPSVTWYERKLISRGTGIAPDEPSHLKISTCSLPNFSFYTVLENDIYTLQLKIYIENTRML